jgi:hypothetical protein
VENGIDAVLRDSIVNKTAIAATTNRTIGGVAPSIYLAIIEKRAEIAAGDLDALLITHAINPAALRSDDFANHFAYRMAELIVLIEQATGKIVQRDLDSADPLEDLAQFDPADLIGDDSIEDGEPELVE